MSTISVRSPIDGKLLGEVPVAGAAEVDAKIARAERAALDWRRTSVEKRVDLFRALRAELIAARARIAECVTREQGKTLLEAYMAEVFPSLDLVSFLIHRGPRLLASKPAPHFQPFLAGRRGRYHFHPYGAWAVIAPWNYPFSIPFLQAATLLFGGNTAVLKPSPLTPLTAEIVADLFRRAGFPAGTLEVAQGGAEVGEQLVKDERVRGVLFTGSVENGRRVLATARGGLKKVILELGGKDAALVLGDADLPRTAKGIAWSAMLNAGQTCASVERVYVERPAAERFTRLLEEEVARIRVGNPLEPASEMGPLTAPFQLERVRDQVEEARRDGAQVRTGGACLPHLGPLYYAPTVVAGARASARILGEETFGPVVAVQAVENEDEALERANDSPYGLTASIWTGDRARARSLAPRLECGVVTVNSHLATYGESNSVWGGFKASGLGRTHGAFGLLETLQVQYVDESFGRAPEICWYPYTERFRGLVEETFFVLGAPTFIGKAMRSLRFLPRLGYLARHVPVWGMLPRFLRYMT